MTAVAAALRWPYRDRSDRLLTRLDQAVDRLDRNVAELRGAVEALRVERETTGDDGAGGPGKEC